MRTDGSPNAMPTAAATTPARRNDTICGNHGRRSTRLYAANAPTAMNAADPSDSWPA